MFAWLVSKFPKEGEKHAEVKGAKEGVEETEREREREGKKEQKRERKREKPVNIFSIMLPLSRDRIEARKLSI